MVARYFQPDCGRWKGRIASRNVKQDRELHAHMTRSRARNQIRQLLPSLAFECGEASFVPAMVGSAPGAELVKCT